MAVAAPSIHSVHGCCYYTKATSDCTVSVIKLFFRMRDAEPPPLPSLPSFPAHPSHSLPAFFWPADFAIHFHFSSLPPFSPSSARISKGDMEVQTGCAFVMEAPSTQERTVKHCISIGRKKGKHIPGNERNRKKTSVRNKVWLYFCILK